MTITNKVSLKSVMGGNTPIPDVVDAPTIGTATAGITSATVAYTAAATGGAATSFTAISTPSSITGTGSSPITVSGLTAGTAYTFKVYGTNASGAWSAVQSSSSNSVTPLSPASFDSIATATGTGSSGVITFSSIPQTYKHLQIRLISRSSGNFRELGTTIRFNSDTGSNYSRHQIYGTNSSVGVTTATGVSSAYIGSTSTGNLSTANIYGHAIVDIHNYSSTSATKTIKSVGSSEQNDLNATIRSVSGVWSGTAAVDTITLTLESGNFTTGSTFALYGIKA